MLERYECISLSMYEESGTFHIVHHINVSEPVVDNVLKHVAGLFTDNISDRHEWTHEKKCTGHSL